MSDRHFGILVFALAIEARKVVHAFRNAGVNAEPVARTDGEFVVATGTARWRSLICGPGPYFQAGLERALERLDRSPSLAILAGFSGGLIPAAQTGTVWVGNQIKSPKGSWELASGPSLGSLLQARLGTIWTAVDPVCSAQAKEALGRSSNSDIVDMESSHFAAHMNDRKIPCAVVRAISDGPREAIPKEVGAWCGPTGSLRPAAMLWDLLTKPYIWPNLPKLAKGANLAGQALGNALIAVVQSETNWRTTTASRP